MFLSRHDSGAVDLGLAHRGLDTHQALGVALRGIMLKQFNSNVIIALFTACAMIAFAFYERYEPSGDKHVVVSYIVAALICLFPVLYAIVRHRTRRNKTPKID